MSDLVLTLCAGLWCLSITQFTRWCVLCFEEKGGEVVDPMSDWAVQLFVRGTSLAVLLIIFRFCR